MKRGLLEQLFGAINPTPKVTMRDLEAALRVVFAGTGDPTRAERAIGHMYGHAFRKREEAYDRDHAGDHPPMTRAATEAVVKRCADHRTEAERLPYLDWHDRAAEAHRKGIRQRRCDECRRWYWPWDMRGRHSRDTQRKDGRDG